MTILRLLFLLFIFSILFDKSTSVILCRKTCRPGNGLVIRFPFRLIIEQPEHCGYPGFELLCNNNQTTIQLPYSGEFTVKSIDYASQIIIINDLNQCLPGRFLHRSFSLSGSPFQRQNSDEFTFLNCSSDHLPNVNGLRYVECLSGTNFSVAAIQTFKYKESAAALKTSCSEISTVWIPVLWPVSSDLAEGVTLRWGKPDCTHCEERGRFCGFKNVKNMEIGCADPSHSTGLPRSAKYGIIIGIGIPGLLCFIGLGCYLCGKVGNYHQRHRFTTDFATSLTPQLAVVRNGLDRPTIESYPKTMVGESGRLPKPNDNTCPICLCEYQTQEILRTIPECNHYYHANCIDEWLKINATCPLCRKSQESSAFVTPSTSTSSSS